MSLHDETKPSPEQMAFDRRDFLRFLSGGALILTSGGLLAGCGGGGNSSDSGGITTSPGPTDQSILFSDTKQATSAGVDITDTVRNIRLIVPPSAVQSPTSVSLRVHDKQREGVAPTGFLSNPNAIDFAIDPASLASQSKVQLEIPAVGPYDSFGSMFFITDDKGNYLPLEVSHDSTRDVLIGTVTKEELQQLASAPQVAGATQSAHAKQLHPHLSLAGVVFGVFSTIIARAISQADTSNFYLYDPNSSNWGGVVNNPNVTGKKIAVVVHGQINDRTNVKDFGNFLSSLPPGIYDQIWCYEYNWKAHIADNGKLFAEQMSSKMTNAIQTDIYAHSMGGLVSRWALEKEGLGNRISRLITLGTPHEGVPAQALQFILWVIGKATGINIADFIPGTDDLSAKQFEDAGSPSFILRLNNTPSPYETSAQYFTLAGTDSSAYVVLGINLVNWYYRLFGANIPNDGIVPVYSALNSPALNNKSNSWARDQANHTATVSLTHNQVKGDDDPIKQKEMTDIVVKWIVDPIGVTIQ